jgi:hypothetical protein
MNDLHDTVFKKARAGDVRFVLLLEKWGVLQPTDSTYQGRIQGLDNAGFRSMSDEELAERAKKYGIDVALRRGVVERPYRFTVAGLVSPTLELREPGPGGELPKEIPWVPLPPDSDEKQPPVVNVKPVEGPLEPVPVVEERKPIVYVPPGGEPLIPHIVRGLNGVARTGEGF